MLSGFVLFLSLKTEGEIEKNLIRSNSTSGRHRRCCCCNSSQNKGERANKDAALCSAWHAVRVQQPPGFVLLLLFSLAWLSLAFSLSLARSLALCLSVARAARTTALPLTFVQDDDAYIWIYLAALLLLLSLYCTQNTHLILKSWTSTRI